MVTVVESKIHTSPLSLEEKRKINAYWRAANYLSVGQIYLLISESNIELLQNHEN